MKDFINGNFKGMVIVSNDSVIAYNDGEKVFDFDCQGPKEALYAVLAAFNIYIEFT